MTLQTALQRLYNGSTNDSTNDSTSGSTNGSTAALQLLHQRLYDGSITALQSPIRTALQRLRGSRARSSPKALSGNCHVHTTRTHYAYTTTAYTTLTTTTTLWISPLTAYFVPAAIALSLFLNIPLILTASALPHVYCQYRQKEKKQA
jgi:hypothetical protein